MAAETVELATVGEYRGHHTVPHELTMQDLRDMVRNFGGAPAVIDYDHATQNPEVQQAKAAGWVVDVFLDGETLMGEVQWNEPAEQSIDQGEYRFLSPVIDFEATDKETGREIGTELRTVGLTNVPFYDHLDPVDEPQNSGLTGQPVTPAMVMNRHSTAANTELGDYIREKRRKMGMAVEELAEKVDLSPSAMSDLERGEIETPPPDRRQKLANALGVEPSTLREKIPESNLKNSDDTMSDSLWSRMKEKFSGVLNTDDEVEMLQRVKQLEEENERLQNKVDELDDVKEERDELKSKLDDVETEQEEEQEQEVEETLDEAVENYKIQNSDREAWEERFEKNPEAAQMALDAIPENAVKPGTSVEEPEDTGDEDAVRPSSGAHEYVRNHNS